MNMWCTGLLCFFLNPFTDWFTNKSKNIVEIIPSTQGKQSNGRPIVSRRPLNNKPIVYEPDALKRIQHNLQHDQRLRQLPFGTLDKIRKLGLNNKPTKEKLHLREHLHQYGANLTNLINIKKSGFKMDSNITFATCNIQSLRYKELQVSQLFTDYALDFIVLTETWLNNNHENWKDTTILNRSNLKLSTVDRGTGKGGGLAIIHNAQHQVKFISSGHKTSFESAIWELRIKNHTMTIHGIYHPPYSTTNRATNTMFIDEFTDYVSSCLPNHNNNIFMGDFNLHVSNQLDTDASIFKDTIDAMGLYQHVDFSTHKSGNVLDLIISDFTDEVKVLKVAPGPFLTDHRAVISTLNIKKLRPVTKRIQVRQVKRIKREQWIEEFTLDKQSLNGKLDLDCLVSALNSELSRVLDTLAPLKECKVNLRAKQPWYDQEMKALKRKMRKYEKKWLKYKLDSLWVAFKKVRNSYYGLLNRKKRTTLQDKIQDCTGDSRRLHKLVSNLTTKQVDPEWPTHTTDDELVESFASHFKGKIDKIRELLSDKPIYSPDDLEVPVLKEFTPMSQDEVGTIISGLKSKSCELDPIPTTILKVLLPKILPLITKIVNKSLGEGVFCREWKTAVVRPLLKKAGLDLTFANYRPVSNLTFISKVIERCMLLQVSKHCEKYHLQPDYQSAYREHYSCETTILKISNDILWGMESQSITSLVALDLSAAFDTVDHDILLSILSSKYGIKGVTLKWFDQYLRPRSFRVAVNGVCSKDRDLTVSVPQGSCAGANIFNLYCSPLQDVVPKDLQLSGFADDHSVRKTFKAGDTREETTTISKLESCLLSIKQWMDQVRLKMNPSKTEFIHFGNASQLHKCFTNSIDVAGDLILRSNVIRYLGVWLDASLNFKLHVTKKCKAAMLNFIRIRGIRHLLTEEATSSLVLSLCVSHLDYCNAVLYGLPDVTISRMQKVQNMCARLVLRRSKWDSAKACLAKLHWLPIRQRIIFKICVLTFKLLHGQGPVYLQDLLHYRHNTRSLRSTMDQSLLLIPRTKLKTFAARSFSVAAPTLWNDLPKCIRDSNTLLSFKRDLKTHLYKEVFGNLHLQS